MKKDTYTTDVIFRKFKDGDIIALMPHEVCDNKGMVTSYMHVGQHGGADYQHVIATTKPTCLAEYSDLKAELESIGYNVKVRQKRNYDKFLISYRKLN